MEQSSDQHASIPAQRQVNADTAKRFGLRIVKSIEILDVSGANVRNAPEMVELLTLIDDPEIHGVVCREFSRLLRMDSWDDLNILQRLSDTNTLLYLPDGPQDQSSFHGRLVSAIRATVAGEERNEFKRRVRSAKEEKRKQGGSPQGRITLPRGVSYSSASGYQYVNPEAEKIRIAFQRVLEGETSYPQLSKLVGIPASALRIILRNPIYTGWRVYDLKRDPTRAGLYLKENGRQADRRKIPRLPEEVIRVRVIAEALVAEDDFQRVQTILREKRQRHWRSTPHYQSRFTYRGFLTCADCGSIIHSSFQRRDYYVCSGRRGAKNCKAPYMDRLRLESRLDRLLSCQLASRKFLRACLKRANRPISDDKNATQKLAECIALAEAKKARILDSYFDGILTAEDRNRRLAIQENEINAFQRELEQSAAPRDVSEESLISTFAHLKNWRNWGQTEKRAVLAGLSANIRVSGCEPLEIGVQSVVDNGTRTDRGSWRRPA